MKQLKLGIFYHLKEKPEVRKYWIGTFTKDGTACEKIIKTIPGSGKMALLNAKLTLQNL